jgi:hypothetical protein
VVAVEDLGAGGWPYAAAPRSDEDADAEGGEGGAGELGEGECGGEVAPTAAHPAGKRSGAARIAVGIVLNPVH